MALISVIVPVYNEEKYLRRCADSILRQSFADFELILIDDGSTDSSGVICDKYAEKDCRVKVIHQPNGGLSAARNSGIEYALDNSDSEWITFIDSDDCISDRLFDRLLNSARESDTEISAVGFLRFCDTDNVKDLNKENSVGAEIVSPEELYTSRRTEATVAWGKLYKKDMFEKVRYPVGKLHEDEFVTYRLLFSLPSIAFTDAPLYYYYRNQGGIMLGSKSIRTDKTEALTGQVEYFRNNGFNRAEMTAACALFVGCALELRDLIENSPKNKQQIRALRRVLRKTESRYRLDKSLVGGDKSYLSLAHPHIEKLRIRAKHAAIGVKKVFHA